MRSRPAPRKAKCRTWFQSMPKTGSGGSRGGRPALRRRPPRPAPAAPGRARLIFFDFPFDFFQRATFAFHPRLERARRCRARRKRRERRFFRVARERSSAPPGIGPSPLSGTQGPPRGAGRDAGAAPPRARRASGRLRPPAGSLLAPPPPCPPWSTLYRMSTQRLARASSFSSIRSCCEASFSIAARFCS